MKHLASAEWDAACGEETAHDYAPEWRDYGRRRGLALALVYGWVPASGAAYLWASARLHEPLLCLPPMLVWWGLMGAAVWWAGEFRCPRCRRRYAASGAKKGLGVVWRGLFEPVCGNCKLRKFARE